MRISDWSSDVCSSDLFAPRWEVTGGLRLSHNPLRFRLMSEGPFAGGSNAVGPRRQSDTPLIPHAALSWRPGSDSMVYLSAGKGFRGGGTTELRRGSCRDRVCQYV